MAGEEWTDVGGVPGETYRCALLVPGMGDRNAAAIAQATTPAATNKTQQQFKKETKNSQKKTAAEEDALQASVGELSTTWPQGKWGVFPALMAEKRRRREKPDLAESKQVHWFVRAALNSRVPARSACNACGRRGR